MAILVVACAPSITAVPTASRPPIRTAASLGPTETPTSLPRKEEQPLEVEATPQPTLLPIPPVSEVDWIRGPRDAPVTLVEYSDFQ